MGHLIHRQTFELKFSSQQQAKDFSPRLSELNQQLILPELERLFTSLAGGKELRFERLEIDLGTLQEAEFASAGIERLRLQITETLQERLNQQSSSELSAQADRPIVSAGMAATVEEQNDSSLAELMATFLTWGWLPWWSDKHTVKNLDQLLRHFLTEQPKVAIELLKKVLADPWQRSRLVEQFSNRSLIAVVTLLAGSSTGEQLLVLRKTTRALLVQNQLLGGIDSFIWSALLVSLLDNLTDRSDLSSLVESFVVHLSGHTGLAVPLISGELQLLLATSQEDSGGRLRALLQQIEQQPQPRQIETVPRSRLMLPEVSAEQSVCEVAVDNAGLVLLWPHLGQLFSSLDLLEPADGQRQRPRPDAALLLQQLVTGRPAGMEASLSLNRLLCGLPAKVPLPRRLMRSGKMDHEVVLLLETVIKQWSALKNTSVAGLRSSFLQREGLLLEEEQFWRLRIERKAYDLLLEQLPWGIAMIQLSWMDKPLQVEW